MFSKNKIIEGQKITQAPTKDYVQQLMLEHIEIRQAHIEAFASRHADALHASGVKAKIEALVKNWKANANFSYKQAEQAIKEILGITSKDEDVIFMLRMFCITKPQFSDFETNYNDLAKEVEKCFI